jgi:hypothetical protein
MIELLEVMVSPLFTKLSLASGLSLPARIWNGNVGVVPPARVSWPPEDEWIRHCAAVAVSPVLPLGLLGLMVKSACVKSETPQEYTVV